MCSAFALKCYHKWVAVDLMTGMNGIPGVHIPLKSIKDKENDKKLLKNLDVPINSSTFAIA